MKIRVFPEHNYKSFYFGHNTVRIAIDSSKPITELIYPEFYDVKITDKCYGACPYCYMNSTPKADPYNDILGKIDSFFGDMTDNERPFQVAIGGGEPTESPDFIESLELFHKLGITPNYTTNGMFIYKINSYIEELMTVTKKCCGGVAVSCHPHLDHCWEEASYLFIENGIRLNFHIIISDANSVDVFKDIYDKWNKVLDYFVLLPYSSQGRGDNKKIDWDYLVSKMPKDTSKIAFGANFYPYLMKNPNLFNVSLYEPESMSKFLDLKDMKIYPSSFHSEAIG